MSCARHRSQGEPQACRGLPSMTIATKAGAGRCGGLSAREIPGNEKAIGRVMNHTAATPSDAGGARPVSAMAAREELGSCCRSSGRAFRADVGETGSLRARPVASRVSRSTKVLLAENGDVIRLTTRAPGLRTRAGGRS
jgi:hypothetical protein